MAISSAADFFAVLEKSDLLTARQLAEARQTAAQHDDPAAIAKFLVRQDLITNWQAGLLLAGRTVFHMGKYKLISLLGCGGMGRVFLAEHVTMNRRVALKVLARQIGKDRASLERFLAEARAIAALDHPNIVRAYNLDTEGGRYYIVMEYIDGLDLQRLVEQEGPLDFARAADYVRQAADGLAHAHSHKMVHCDIKPSNLLVNNQGVVKILDMGLARLLGREGADQGPDERVLGSVDYLSPEQALGSPDFDHRADIYSLGCTLYFLLTGHPPFPEGTLAQRIVQHQTQEPRSLRDERPETPLALVGLCAKMMAKKAEERFQSAEEISRVLQQWKPPAAQSQPVVLLKTADEEEVAAADGDFTSDSWWTSLSATPARDSGRMRAVKTAAATAPLAAAATAVAVAGKPAAQRSQGGVAAFCREKLQWFNTPQRKIAALGGAGLVAAVAIGGVVLLAMGLGSSAPAPPHQAVEVVKRPPVEKTVPDIDPSELKTANAPDAPRVKPKVEPAGPTPEKSPPPSLAPDKGPKNVPPPKTPATEPPAKPKKEEPAKSAPAATAIAKVEPATPAQKPPSKTPPAAKKENPLRDVKPTPLPAITDSASSGAPPASFGAVHLGPDDSLSVQLLNGEHAGRGTPKFSVQQKADGAQKANWIVSAATAGGADDSSPGVDVARIWLDQEALDFQWLKGAADARADCLCNCGLLLTIGAESRFVPLRIAEETPALAIDLDKGMAKKDWKINLLPDAAALQLQLLDTDKAFPKHDVKVSEAAPAHGRAAHGGRDAPAAAPPGNAPIPVKGKADILFTDGAMPTFGVRVLFEAKGRNAVTVTASALYNAALLGIPHRGRDPYVPFKPRDATKLAGQLEVARATLKSAIDKIKDDKQKKAAQEKLKQADSLAAQLTAYREALQKNVLVQFRIYTEVGGEQESHQVDLLKTTAVAADTAAADVKGNMKGNPKGNAKKAPKQGL
jgi:serine/threonine protein kinase